MRPFDDSAGFRSRRPRRLRVESLENRRVLSGLPLGADTFDTAEFMLGRVAVTPIFFESTGSASTQDWSAAEIDGVLEKIHDSMQWWSDTLATFETGHSLEFVYDETYARSPVQTPYEPIDRTSNEHNKYLEPFLEARGIDNTLMLQDAVRAFNHQQRLAMDADWGVTLLVIDASDDLDGGFAAGGSFSSAFAYAGGAYMVVPSTRPASVFAHELGHLFWAQDEYPDGDSWSEQRGYYNTLNLNAADNPTPGFTQEISIMSGGTYRSTAYQNHVSSASTLALVGWQDSDADGIFDVLDVPLRLDGVGQYQPAAGQFEFHGSASAVPLLNRNSEGLGNDITLNRISRVEYRIDGGSWQTAMAPDLQVTEVSFAVPLSPGFDSFEIRAIDASSGVTSPIITATSATPGVSPSSIQAYAFVDADGDQMPGAAELPVERLTATVVTALDGQLPATGGIAADQFQPGASLEDLQGVQLSTDAAYSDGRVSVAADAADGGGNRFAWYRATWGQWIDRWTAYERLEARLDQPTSAVSVTVAAPRADAVGRLEAYDAEGNLLARDSSERLADQQSVVLQVQDPANRIAMIRVFGHAGTEILITDIQYGPPRVAVSDTQGVLRLENYPDGTYQLSLEPQLVIHQVDQPLSVSVVNGQAVLEAIAVRRIASTWQNPDTATDVDASGSLDPWDALLVINYLNRRGSGPLPEKVAEEVFVDTDGDGRAAPIDALLVINELNRQAREERAQGERSAPPVEGAGHGENAGSDRLTQGEPAVLAVDRLMASSFDVESLGKISGPLQPWGREDNDYADGTEPKPENLEDPLKPFFSEPLRSEGF